MCIPLGCFSGAGLSNHDNYLVFGELSRTLVPLQVSLRGSEAGSDLPSRTSDRRQHAHHFVKLRHLGIDRKFLPGFKDLSVLFGVRPFVEWIHVPCLYFC